MEPALVVDALTREQAEDRDEKGNRTIRHSGRGARLVSRVDAKGRLLRQELTLGQDVVVWAHGTRIRTGILANEAHDASHAGFDREPSRTRLDRARQTLEKHAGKDKYLKHLARAIALSVGLTLPGAEVVTVGEVQRAAKRSELRAQQRRRQFAGWLVGGGIAAVVLLIVLAVLHR